MSTPYIASRSLKRYEIEMKPSELIEEINYYDENGFEIEVEYNEGNEEESKGGSYIFNIVLGLICIFLLILACIAIIYSYNNADESDRLIAYIPKWKNRIYKVIPIYIYGFASAIVTLVISYFLLKDMQFNIIKGIGIIGAYQIALFIIAFLLVYVVKKDVIVLLMPIMILFVIVTHPIFIDITTYIPEMKKIVGYLPTYWVFYM